METTGKIRDISRDLMTNKFIVSLELDEAYLSDLKAEQEKGQRTIVLRDYKKKRSLDANAYYWVLVEKISKLSKTIKNAVHNIMLERYGTLDRMPDGNLIPICIKDEIDHRELDYMHLKPTSKTLTKGETVFRWYYLIKGSSEYDTAEMSALIDGIISECKEMEIETLSPLELQRMKEAWKGCERRKES